MEDVKAVVAVVIHEKDGCYLVYQAAGQSKGLWGFPGGHIEPREHPETAAVREVLEETTMNIELLSLIGIYSMPTRSENWALTFAYKATLIGKDETRSIPKDEILEVKLFPYMDIFDMPAEQHRFPETKVILSRSLENNLYPLDVVKPIHSLH